MFSNVAIAVAVVVILNSLMLFIATKVSLLVYNIVMPLGIVPQIPCQLIFVPSDPGVPRTFVVDCMSIALVLHLTEACSLGSLRQ